VAVKVFVSSTYIDLKDHRQRVIAQLRRAGYHVDPMEDWTSDANEPRQFSLERLDGCQACVLLVGFRRGFVPPGHTHSITQMEYDHARDRGIDVLPFLLDEGVTGWPEPYDDRLNDPLLQEWREALGLRHGVQRFTADPTSVDVLPALARWQARRYERERLEAAGFTPAAQLRFDDLTVGGTVTQQGGTVQPRFGDTRRADPAGRNRRAMIEKVWAIWITGVLQPSLPQDILLELGLSERPALVTRAFDLLVQPDLTDRALAPGTPLVDVFDRLDRALLVLGAPGSGKTTLLLTLARDLLRRAAQDPEQPIPVVFPLSSWAAPRRPLAVWLVDELQQRYDVPRTIGQAWVDADQVLPLLDGLDEVQPEHRAACVDAINTFRQGHGLLPLVVCSRITEFEALGVQLRLQGAIIVQPLTHAQVNGYLTQIGEPLAAVRQGLQEDPLLRELLDTPLMLTIVSLAYAGQPAGALRTRATLAERRQSLFATYVDRMFQRRSAVTRYTRQQTERWLAWLAWQLDQHSQTDFYLERLQPDWLPAGRRSLPTQGTRLVAGMVGGLLGGLLAGLGVWLFVGLGGGLRAGFFAALFAGLIATQTGYFQKITPIETVRWSWSKFLLELLLPSSSSLNVGLFGRLGTGLLSALASGLSIVLGIGVLGGALAGVGAVLGARLGGGLGIGLLVGLGTELGGGLVSRLGGKQGTGLVVGLGIGLVYKLLIGFAAGLSGGEITMKTVPNEGTRRSVRMAVSTGLASGLSAGLLAGLLGKLLAGLFGELHEGLLAGLGAGLVAGPLVGLAIGFNYGGRACLQHLVLRLSLRYYDYIPRRYADFLDYAAERLFLRRVGGGYIFIHRLLQEHFAARYQPNRVDSPPQSPVTPP
jgi:eukaryotic-like serine/threonine-protein kinase